MHDRSDTNTQAMLRLRVERFDLMTRVLGCESDTARAALINMTYQSVRRAKRDNIIGGVFVAQTIAALRRHREELQQYGLAPTFDDLFEIVEEPATERVKEREPVAA